MSTRPPFGDPEETGLGQGRRAVASGLGNRARAHCLASHPPIAFCKYLQCISVQFIPMNLRRFSSYFWFCLPLRENGVGGRKNSQVKTSN